MSPGSGLFARKHPLATVLSVGALGRGVGAGGDRALRPAPEPGGARALGAWRDPQAGRSGRAIRFHVVPGDGRYRCVAGGASALGRTVMSGPTPALAADGKRIRGANRHWRGREPNPRPPTSHVEQHRTGDRLSPRLPSPPRRADALHDAPRRRPRRHCLPHLSEPRSPPSSPPPPSRPVVPVAHSSCRWHGRGTRRGSLRSDNGVQGAGRPLRTDRERPREPQGLPHRHWPRHIRARPSRSALRERRHPPASASGRYCGACVDPSPASTPALRVTVQLAPEAKLSQ